MKTTALSTLGLLFLCAPAVHASEEVHGAHEHGTGVLNVAIEGGTVEIELIAPGADIAGFEHPPASDADRQAVADAAATLRDGDALFGFPDDAGCTLAEATVESGLLGEAESDASPEHAEFHARYRFDCAAADQVREIELRYFGLFPAARELDASVLTETGQTAVELTPDAARLPL